MIESCDRNVSISMTATDKYRRLAKTFRRAPHFFLALLIVVTGLQANVNGKEDRASRIATKVSPGLKTELAKKKLRWGAPVYMRIFKESNELELWIQGNGKAGEYALFKNYKICYWSGKLGPKLKQGDHQSPEGLYSVSAAQMNPHSRYHLSFNLGYPNAYDRAKKRTGNYLMVHGNCVSIGCYAMGDENIEEIYTLAAAALKNGQKNFAVHCFPFRMIKSRMRQSDVTSSQWLPFWQDLQKAYRSFETHWRPPVIKVINGRYVVKDGKGER